MSARFSYQGDDFCIIHGRDYMVQEFGNPIPFCEECEEEAMPKEAERAAKKPDEPVPQD
jgi:hypothetical protein